jgi:hypothetical protein
MSGFLIPSAYSDWQHCGVGSTVTTEEISETTMDLGVLRNVTITKGKLIALDSGKAALELEVVGAVNGAPFEMKNTLELPLHPAPDQEDGLMSFDEVFKGTVPKESEETIEIAGRSLVCRRTEHAATLHGQPFSIIFWKSDQVPGGIARSETRMGTGHVTKTTVTAFEKR